MKSQYCEYIYRSMQIRVCLAAARHSQASSSFKGLSWTAILPNWLTVWAACKASHPYRSRLSRSEDNPAVCQNTNSSIPSPANLFTSGGASFLVKPLS